MNQPLPQRPENTDGPAVVDSPLTDAECQARKAEFLAMLSHELRTPLSVIKLYVEAIQDGMYDNQDQAFARLDAKFLEFEHLMEELLQRGKE
ncbi:histidine kinase dimerization/phospho-acceptor domain-containing protein [Shewanella cyperi]|uniref:histidine kinase dimerization/phospho-acceptor domain-containing protein n=1 Tax=Shewanella cyperi TaxID=2814292 RepID=UPI001A93B9DF|nr:histidine kinase dimerization/phospho-acceptor domain-containing protein [Shewanella cyperi]QSX41112.1 hypothetical protein JYB84_01340 [Shewanella cyperi]